MKKNIQFLSAVLLLSCTRVHGDWVELGSSMEKPASTEQVATSSHGEDFLPRVHTFYATYIERCLQPTSDKESQECKERHQYFVFCSKLMKDIDSRFPPTTSPAQKALTCPTAQTEAAEDAKDSLVAPSTSADLS